MINIKPPHNKTLDDISCNHGNNIKKIIQKRIVRKHKEPLSEIQKNFLKNKLLNILTDKPDSLLKLHKQAIDVYKINMSVLQRVFSYDDFIKKEENKYNAYELAKILDVNVCPYCNLNFTHTVIRGDKKIVRPDFDHFFPQHEYPLLALSFYNLIPCCSICNSRLKRGITVDLENYYHPYLKNIVDKIIFKYIPKNVQANYGLDNKNISIEIDVSNTANDSDRLKIQNSINMFKLEERYNLHVDYISELLAKRYKTNDTYLDSIQKLFGDSDFSKEELYRIAFGNYHKNEGFDKRPLSKLISDIIDELKFYIPDNE